MEKEKLKNERFLKIHFIDGQVIADVNNSSDWQEILNKKEKIVRIESDQWSWDLQTGKISFH